LTLPLAIPFGILALLVTGQTVNIFQVWFVLLFGVVKKNGSCKSITRTDYAGRAWNDMTRSSRRIDRLRPILMTTIALVAGMTPLVLRAGGRGTNDRSACW